MPDFSLAPAPFPLLAHGGVVGLLAEIGIVLAGLALFGFLLWRSSRKERERE